MHALTIVGATIGSTYAFFIIIREDTKDFKKSMKEDMIRLYTHHREDMKRIDDKWERLFERLLIPDKNN